MQTLNNLSLDDFREIIKKSVEETLSEKKIKKIFTDVLEDLSLGKAIDEGLKTETIDSKKFLRKLKHKILQD